MATVDENGLDDLERYLSRAAILDVAVFPQHGAHRSFRLILEGGVGVLAKPADTIGEGSIVCRREAAAWALARGLGWSETVATTILRTIPSPESGDDVEASLQVLWPDVMPDADPGSFPDEDIWKAGTFDALIGHSDRGGHNWLAVPASGTTPRLKLVDHGYGFPETVSPPASTFYEMRRGQPLPDEVLGALEPLASSEHLESVRWLLPPAVVAAVLARAEALLSRSVLEISST
jgi:hypothetical protein